jgi:hypothetical protein
VAVVHLGQSPTHALPADGTTLPRHDPALAAVGWGSSKTSALSAWILIPARRGRQAPRLEPPYLLVGLGPDAHLPGSSAGSSADAGAGSSARGRGQGLGPGETPARARAARGEIGSNRDGAFPSASALAEARHSHRLESAITWMTSRDPRERRGDGRGVATSSCRCSCAGAWVRWYSSIFERRTPLAARS